MTNSISARRIAFNVIVVLSREAIAACVLVKALRMPPRSSGVASFMRSNVAICSTFACLPFLAPWNMTM